MVLRTLCRLYFHTFPRLRLDNFDFWMPGSDLLLEPLAGILVPVPEQNRPGIHLADEIEEFTAIGVGGEIKALQFTASRDFPCSAKNEGLTRLGCLEAPSRGARVRIAHKKDGMSLVTNHSHGQVVRRRILIH